MGEPCFRLRGELDRRRIRGKSLVELPGHDAGIGGAYRLQLGIEPPLRRKPLEKHGAKARVVEPVLAEQAIGRRPIVSLLAPVVVEQVVYERQILGESL